MRAFLRTILLTGLVGIVGVSVAGCDRGGEHAVVDSGTYEGTIAEVNPDEREIYVDYEGSELELYFTDETTLTQGGQALEFDVLAEGQRVRVQIERVGNRLDPVSVEILE